MTRSDNNSLESGLKAELRQQLRTRLLQLPAPARRTASRAICERILDLPRYRQSQYLALYLAMPTEVDLGLVAEHANAAGKITCVPLITGPGTMEFCRFRPGDELLRNAYGMPEPLAGSERIDVARLDLMLVPLLGFDRQGHRLGNGGGYYDRLLAQPGRAAIAGVGFSCQQLEVVPTQPWDAGLELLITEAEYLQF